MEMICLGKKICNGEFEGKAYSHIKFWFADNSDPTVCGYKPVEIKNPSNLDLNITDVIGQVCSVDFGVNSYGKPIVTAVRPKK